MFGRRSRTSQTIPPLRPLIEEHLGGAGLETHVLSHRIRLSERVNLQRVVDAWLESDPPAGRLVGYTSTSYRSDEGLAQMLTGDSLYQAPVEREEMESGPGEFTDVVKQGLYLLHRKSRPLVLLFRPGYLRSDLPVLELLARDRGVARDALRDLLAEADRRNIYRGRCVSVDRSGSWDEGYAIRFHELRPTVREQIILPEDVLRVVERNVFGLLEHRDGLRRAGRSTRHGLLFYGAPGTGKTLTVRYLASQCPGHTVVLLTGRQLATVRESCQLARLLAPSIVILEDVDLIAWERSENGCPALLNELLDEMDGLGPRAECIFLLTTNRPEALEPALSARPGRIDQAVEFPLPDAEGRQRLFGLFGFGLDLSAVDLDRWVARTDGVSPAFIEELLRRAALLALDRGESGEPLPIGEADLDEALRELVFSGGELTQKLLGYRPSRLGYQPPSA